MAHDQHLRPAEERRGAQVVERPSETLGVLAGPQGAPRTRPARRQEPRAERVQRAPDQEGLVAEEEVVRAERVAAQGGERIGRRAQKPSIACR